MLDTAPGELPQSWGAKSRENCPIESRTRIWQALSAPSTKFGLFHIPMWAHESLPLDHQGPRSASATSGGVMLSPRRLALIPVAFLLLASAAAGALTLPRMRVDGSVPLPMGSPVRIADRARQAELERLPAWTDFLSRHGPWNALWNDATQTPHRAFGRGIPLPGFADHPQDVDRAVRRFVAEHSALFGTPTLATLAVDRAGGRWYVRYRQTMNGVPVLFSDWEFRVGLNGKLFAFGADLERPACPADATARPRGAAAREAA